MFVMKNNLCYFSFLYKTQIYKNRFPKSPDSKRYPRVADYITKTKVLIKRLILKFLYKSKASYRNIRSYISIIILQAKSNKEQP